jgi:hypothetical protein
MRPASSGPFALDMREQRAPTSIGEVAAIHAKRGFRWVRRRASRTRGRLSRVAVVGGLRGMARRQRTLYEIVDPGELATDEPPAGVRVPPASNETTGTRARGRVAAGLALLVGLGLFTFGVWHLRSPQEPDLRARLRSSVNSVQRSVLPARPARHRFAGRSRRRGHDAPPRHINRGPHRYVRSQRPRVTVIAGPRPALAVTSPSQPVTPQAAPATHPVRAAQLEFGFER